MLPIDYTTGVLFKNKVSPLRIERSWNADSETLENILSFLLVDIIYEQPSFPDDN